MTGIQTTTPQRVVTVIPALNHTDLESQNKYRQLRVAAYCRVSTESEEQQSSFEAQRDFYNDKIQRNPEWRLAGIFADDGISGTQAKKRPEFMRMIKLCKQKKIDIILTKSISRFARNNLDCLNYIRMLKERGIAVIFEKEGINTLTMASEMLISMLGAFAQAESESLSKNVSWGKHQSYKQGNVPFAYGNLLGYRKGANGNPEIDLEQAKIVKRIFDDFLNGKSIVTIKQELESEEIKTVRGKVEWSTSTIRQMLSNERFKGDALLQKTFITDPISKKSRRNIGQLPQYYVANSHPAIIDPAVFDRVQEELARRGSKRKVSSKGKTEQGKYSSKYALTELLICGHCGTPYRRVTWTLKGKKKIVWRCINRLDYGKKYCSESPTLEESVIQNALVRAIIKVLLDQVSAAEVLKMNIGRVLGADADDNEYVLQHRMAELRDQRSKMLDLIVHSNSNSENYDDQFKKIADELEELSERLKEIKGNLYQRNVTVSVMDQISAILEKHKVKPIEYDDIIIRQLIECVKVNSKDTITVIFRNGFKCEESL